MCGSASIHVSALVIVGHMFLMGTALAAASSGRPPRKAIHPQVRQWAGPADGKEVAVNPPPLLWPLVSGRGARYSVRLSQDRSFSPANTIGTDGFPWAAFNAHTKLAAGKWYWQYGVAKANVPTKWSDVFEFRIPASARDFVTPPADEMVKTCPRSHPRVLITTEEIEAFRNRVKQSSEARSIVRRAKRFVGKPLPSEESGRPKHRGKNRQQNKKFATWASKALASKMSGSVSMLVKAYLISGDEQFGREAIRRAVHVAGWDPNGITGRRVSDFADGSCLRAMTLAYDSCYTLLKNDEKKLLLKGIQIRAGRMFRGWCNRLESRVFSAHIWQHILREFTEAAFATFGEIPDAEQWAKYVYEIWIARVPLQGGNDGGWANGNNYFGTNYGTLISIPVFFRNLTGVNFFDHPWYQNTPYYMLYTWPPGSCNDGFGDGCDRRGLPTSTRIGFADVLSRELRIPAASWYVRECLKAIGRKAPYDSLFAWYRLRAGIDRKPAPVPADFDLPQARAFRDVGIVAMHTHLTDTPRDLMVAFRSSPYGSFNHAHADQNAFNVLFGGERLFISSGYYIAYGDEHFRGWYKHTRGHNSVLIDGKGQTFGAEGYGWIARYLHGERITYCLGDASAAYGKAGLTRFRRHVALLRPSTIVVYDDLEADHPAQWSWLLHSPQKMTIDARSKQRILAAVTKSRGQIDLYGSVPLRITVNDVFDPPAVNWRKTKNKDGSLKQYPNQWHATAASREKTRAMRYLAIIQVLPRADRRKFSQPTEDDQGWIRVGNWRIRAEMDRTKPPTLEVCVMDQSAALAVDTGAVTLEGKRYETDQPNSSILVEITGTRRIFQQTVDELPQAAR